MITSIRRRGFFPIVLVMAGVLIAVSSVCAAAGDPRRGEALFVGSAPFAEGGAPCLACHAMAGLGLAGGASYGPDLSSMFEDYGAQGVSAILESLPFPSMVPIFAGRPLTAGERSDLTAFLETVGQGEAPEITGTLILEVALGTAILLFLAFLSGRRRLRGVRLPLEKEALKRKR